MMSAITRSFDLTPLESFNGQNLPTNKEVLRRFFSVKDTLENKSEKNSFFANFVTANGIGNILPFYQT